MPKFCVYILECINCKRNLTYTGYTIDIKKRLNKHNHNKGAKFTRGRKWKVIYRKFFISKKKAMSYEYKLKNNYILKKEIIKKYGYSNNFTI